MTFHQISQYTTLGLFAVAGLLFLLGCVFKFLTWREGRKWDWRSAR